MAVYTVMPRGCSDGYEARVSEHAHGDSKWRPTTQQLNALSVGALTKRYYY